MSGGGVTPSPTPVTPIEFGWAWNIFYSSGLQFGAYLMVAKRGEKYLPVTLNGKMWYAQRSPYLSQPGQTLSLEFEPSPISQDDFAPVNKSEAIALHFPWALDAEKYPVEIKWIYRDGADWCTCPELPTNVWTDLEDSSATTIIPISYEQFNVKNWQVS